MNSEPGFWGWIYSLVVSHASYIWFVLLGCWGGTGRYLERLSEQDQPFSWRKWFAGQVISGFAGLIGAYIAESLGAPFVLAAATAGIFGNMGAEAMKVIRSRAKTKMADAT